LQLLKNRQDGDVKKDVPIRFPLTLYLPPVDGRNNKQMVKKELHRCFRLNSRLHRATVTLTPLQSGRVLKPLSSAVYVIPFAENATMPSKPMLPVMLCDEDR
jgi:hypothetical protein